ncbi:AraC family transcriptional regulator [Clostridium tetani]|uniref:effector binding domain-containing protein n=1 Tax=Clostridium tetani TaxID=1513 RepID=UPI000D2093D7|nr:effector binding domain-containing protein [Clostridium tetani]AVP55214.1 AraC family transcriptional regulator [Clostridium tetani]
MNYRKDIEKCIKFIEDHIKENITIKEIANESGYSLYHFCRVFSLCKGMSLKVFKIGGYIMNPVIVKRPAFKVAGYGIKTNITGGTYTKDIASFWSNYNGENLENKMYKILNPPKHGEVGLCVPLSEDGNAIYLLGVIVDDFSKVEENMLTVEVPAAEYAVFTTTPVDTTNDKEQKEFAKIIKGTWKYIFEDWFKDSGYVYDESKLDFEFYDERCHYRQDTVMEIYVPVKKVK